MKHPSLGWGPERWGPERWSPEGWSPPNPKKLGPEGWGPEGWRPKGGGPKISRFFFPLPPQFFILFSLSCWSFPLNFGGVFEAPGPSNVRVWRSRPVVCEPRRPSLVGPPGFHTTAREPKRAHLSAPVFKNTTKIQREDLPEREETKKFSVGEGKKERNFGRSGEGRSGGGGPGERPKNLEHTHHTHTNNNHQQAPPTSTTNRHHQPQAPTGTNRHQQAPTGTNRHQQAPTGTNRHQQAPTDIYRKLRGNIVSLRRSLGS